MRKIVTYSSRSSYLLVFINFSLLLFISSCSIEKRIYRPGYSVNWKNVKTHSDFRTNNQSIESEEVSIIDETISTQTLADNQFLVKSFTEPIKKVTRDDTYPNNFEDSTDCDIIILQNGTEIKVKIKEIGTDEITYTKCEGDSNTILSVKIDDISQVKIHKNSVESNSRSHAKEYDSPKIEPFGLAGLICSVIPFIIPLGGILGIIFGSISLKRIKREPNKYKGKGFAIAGLILGIIQIVAIIVLIALFLILLMLF